MLKSPDVIVDVLQDIESANNAKRGIKALGTAMDYPTARLGVPQRDRKCARFVRGFEASDAEPPPVQVV